MINVLTLVEVGWRGRGVRVIRGTRAVLEGTWGYKGVVGVCESESERERRERGEREGETLRGRESWGFLIIREMPSALVFILRKERERSIRREREVREGRGEGERFCYHKISAWGRERGRRFLRFFLLVGGERELYTLFGRIERGRRERGRDGP